MMERSTLRNDGFFFTGTNGMKIYQISICESKKTVENPCRMMNLETEYIFRYNSISLSVIGQNMHKNQPFLQTHHWVIKFEIQRKVLNVSHSYHIYPHEGLKNYKYVR